MSQRDRVHFGAEGEKVVLPEYEFAGDEVWFQSATTSALMVVEDRSDKLKRAINAPLVT